MCGWGAVETATNHTAVLLRDKNQAPLTRNKNKTKIQEKKVGAWNEGEGMCGGVSGQITIVTLRGGGGGGVGVFLL